MKSISLALFILWSAATSSFGYPLQALRITIIPCAMIMVFGAIIQSVVPLLANDITNLFWAIIALTLVILGLTLLAIFWHRHILGHAPQAITVRLFLRYCLPAFLISMVFVLCISVAELTKTHYLLDVTLKLYPANAVLADLLFIVVVYLDSVALILASYLGLRLSPALPAAALGHPIKLRVAWRLTRNLWAVAIMLALFQAGLGAALASAEFFIFPSGTPATIYGILLWAESLFAVAIITTLYQIVRPAEP